MTGLCVGILACNNEDEIADCLESVSWADERIVILDTRSNDRTAAIAEEMGARVVPHRFENFALQREYGLSLPDAEWLFYVDSDERATPELAREIRRVIEDETHVGWWVPRRNFMWGHEIRHGGWHPDYQLRLLKLGHAHYDMTREVHEVVELEGREYTAQGRGRAAQSPAGYLREPLLHYNYRTMGQFIAKQRQYVGYEAEILHKQGIHPKPWTYLLQPLREFWRRYITLKCYKDGLHGFLLCAMIAYYYGFVATVKAGRLARRS
jgi:hypothetical protein